MNDERKIQIENLINEGAYGWLITDDHLAAPHAEPGTYQNAVGVFGGNDTPFTPEEIRTLGLWFKMYDDDGELYYSGYCLCDEGESLFNPLDDFGLPNAGASEIHYRNAKNGNMESI